MTKIVSFEFSRQKIKKIVFVNCKLDFWRENECFQEFWKNETFFFSFNTLWKSLDDAATFMLLDFQIRIWNGSFVFYCPFPNDFQYVFPILKDIIGRVAKIDGRCRLRSFVWKKQSNYFEAYATKIVFIY